jgi:hypothetical protein
VLVSRKAYASSIFTQVWPAYSTFNFIFNSVVQFHNFAYSRSPLPQNASEKSLRDLGRGKTLASYCNCLYTVPAGSSYSTLLKKGLILIVNRSNFNYSIVLTTAAFNVRSSHVLHMLLRSFGTVLFLDSVPLLKQALHLFVG